MLTKTIAIRPATGHWVVRAGGAVIGESPNALELIEEGNPPVIYFPRDHIEMDFLDRSESTTVSPNLGQATYYSIGAQNGTLPDAAWSFETPNAEAAEIEGFVAFHVRDGITVEQL